MYCSMVFELNRVFSEKCIIRRHLFGQLVAKLRPFSLKSVLLILYIQASLIPQALMRPTIQWLQQLEPSEKHKFHRLGSNGLRNGTQSFL